MQNWNAVATAHEGGFTDARRLLETFGSVEKTEFFNVFVMRVDDIPKTLELLRRKIDEEPGTLNFLARVVAFTHTFNFDSPANFEEKAREIISQFLPALAQKRFHVRMRRRGFKGRLSSMDEERFLDEHLLSALERNGTYGSISFEGPDFIIAVETVGTRAGVSIWSRDDLLRYEFLKLK